MLTSLSATEQVDIRLLAEYLARFKPSPTEQLSQCGEHAPVYCLMPTLTTPAIQYRDSFLAGAAEFLAEGRLNSTYAVYLGYNLETLAERFPQFVLDLKGFVGLYFMKQPYSVGSLIEGFFVRIDK